MKKKILWMLLSFLLVVSLVLASCAKEEVVEEEEEEEEEAVVEEEEAVVEEEEEPAVGVPQYGGTLSDFRWTPDDPITIDVHKAVWPTVMFVSPVLDHLITGDLDKYGPGRGGAYEGAYPFLVFDDIPLKYSKGALAESWEVTADKITLHIRPGVLWAAHGKEHIMKVREVTPEDIAWCMLRFINESSAEGLAGWLWTKNGGFVDAVYAEGDTVVVETSSFNVRWKHFLVAGWGVFFFPPEMVEQDLSDFTNLVGTGPFMVKEHVLGSYISYDRNPTYWDTTIIDGKEYELPFVDELIKPLIIDVSTRIAALRTGKLDYYFETPVLYEETLAQTSPWLVKWVRLGKPDYMALNLHNEYLANYNVRRALMMAVDRAAVNRAVFGPGGDHNTFPVAEVVPDVHTPFDELPLEVQEYLTYDPVKAKRLLAEAGYPEGFRLTLLVSSVVPEYIEMGSMVKDFWDRIGVELTIKIVEPAAYTAMTYLTPLAERFAYDVALQGDAAHDAPLCGLRDTWSPTAVQNLPNWVDEHYAAQFEYAHTIIDDAERDAVLKELAVYGLRQAVYLPFGSPAVVYYHQPWVKNYFGEKDAGCVWFNPILARIWIDQVMKAEMGFK